MPAGRSPISEMMNLRCGSRLHIFNQRRQTVEGRTDRWRAIKDLTDDDGDSGFFNIALIVLFLFTFESGLSLSPPLTAVSPSLARKERGKMNVGRERKLASQVSASPTVMTSRSFLPTYVYMFLSPFFSQFCGASSLLSSPPFFLTFFPFGLRFYYFPSSLKPPT